MLKEHFIGDTKPWLLMIFRVLNPVFNTATITAVQPAALSAFSGQHGFTTSEIIQGFGIQQIDKCRG